MIEAAGQRYRQTTQFLYLGGIIHETADLWLEIERRIRLMPACFKRFGPELYDRKTAPIRLKVRMLKAEVTETLLYAGGVLRGLSVRNISPSSERCTAKSSCRSLAFSADNLPTTPPSRTRRCPRRHDARASKGPSLNGGSSLRWPWRGEARGDYPVV